MHYMGYEKKLAKSFRQAEPQKLTYGLLLLCFIVLLTYLSISKPYDAILSTISLKSSSSDSVQSDLMNISSVESNTGCSNSSSRSAYLCQSDVMQRNSSSADMRSDLPPAKERDEVKDIQDFVVGSTNTTSNYTVAAIASANSSESSGGGFEPIINPEKWESMCDYSNRRSDVCDLTGDIRIALNQRSVTLVARSQSNGSHRIRPYARKSDPSAMSTVAEIKLKASPIQISPQCTQTHFSPALIFSVGGYAGNYFHDFSDILLPLFQTSRSFNGKVHFLTTDFNSWWVKKYLPIFQSLTDYEILRFDEAESGKVHCFHEALIGLRSSNDLMLANGESMANFTEFLRRAYRLERNEPVRREGLRVKKARLLIVARRKTRKFVNLEKIVKLGRKVGFEVVVAEADGNVAKFAVLVNSCDVMMGVHGAGLTNLVFLPTDAVVIQVIPWGKLEWISRTYFKEPAISMKLKYLEYEIEEEESSLMEIYGRDDLVMRQPESVNRLGWLKTKEIYLEKQNVRINLRRFRGVLVEAMRLLRQK